MLKAVPEIRDAAWSNRGFMNTARIIFNTRAETTIMSTVYM